MEARRPIVIIQAGAIMAWIRVVIMVEVVRTGCILDIFIRQSDRIYWWDQLPYVKEREQSGMTPRFLAYSLEGQSLLLLR